MKQCPGCGHWFKGDRGVRAHRTKKFVSLACKLPEKEAD